MNILNSIIGAVIVLGVRDVWEGLHRWLKERSRMREVLKKGKETAYYATLSKEEQMVYSWKPYHHSRMTKLREWLNLRISSYRL